FNASAYQIEGRSYAISHRAGQHDDAPPVHVEGIRTSMDARPPSGRPRLSPHALLQEYLNSTEHLWGIVTNGERLRLLRDSSHFTRPAYVEFDLRAMFEGEKFSEFALLYRLIHRSRLPQDSTDASSCLLEKYHQQAVETGGRVREKLRDGVELALRTLGSSLLEHPANTALRAKLVEGKLTPLAYYRQLLKLIYRLLFLMVVEERGLIATGTRRLTAAEDDPFEITSVQSFDALLASLVRGPSVTDRLRIYYNHYSVARLRRLAEQPGTGRGPYDDLWMGLQTTFRLLEGSDEQSPRSLGLAPLDGDLFGPEAIADLEGQRLRNADLLRAIRALSLYREKESKALRRVNYGALDVEELGSVYESLLDYRPVVGAGGASFDLVTGTERKTTGSYYTRPELVQELIKSALVPVIEDRLRAAADERRKTKDERPTLLGSDPSSSVLRPSSPEEQALLSIRIVDPACGSGHFLLAAARRLGRELAKVRSGEDQPTPALFRRAVRDVIQHCIYGVDLNPLAVDLCKLALWIEGHNAGMPLNFLDHHIKQGNSLIGATRALVAAGIPDDAYKPVTGDDKKIAFEIKKRNKAERERYLLGYDQRSLFDAPTNDGGAALADALRQLDDMSAGTVAEVRA
ncbi:MAG TPA: DNA methyltransferase, partial [Roseiflexaceae bacterium]